MDAPDEKTPIVTFARRKKVQAEPELSVGNKAKADSSVAFSATPTAVSDENVQQNGEKRNGDCSPGSRWRRVATTKLGQTADSSSVADLKAYYEEASRLFLHVMRNINEENVLTLNLHCTQVDAYVLPVETPTPPGKIAVRKAERLWANKKLSKHMSFGLSRRASVVAPDRSILGTLQLPSSPRTSFIPTAADSANTDGQTKTTSAPSSSLASRLSAGYHGILRRISTLGGVSPISEHVENEQHDAVDSSTLESEEEHLVKALTELEIHDKTGFSSSPMRPERTLSALSQLVQLCGQKDEEHSLPNMNSLMHRYLGSSFSVRKIGEGTFGEAFKANDIILKIVPLEGSQLVNGEVQKKAEEILAEALITLKLSQLRDRQNESAGPALNITSGFVETYNVALCQGPYAPKLLEEWHRWDEQYGSENEAVDVFTENQLFVASGTVNPWNECCNSATTAETYELLFLQVFLVADGGSDLEHFEVKSFEEAQSILLQTTLSLAVAEEALNFEHRDLHWGNILVQRNGRDKATFTLRGVDIDVEIKGLQVTIIDFTLSRLDTTEQGVAFCDLSLDPALFQGPKGDYQAETYRRMQKATKGDWQRFVPRTNCVWLAYLADIFLSAKMPASSGKEYARELRNFRKQALAANRAAELVWSEIFVGLWTACTDTVSE